MSLEKVGLHRRGRAASSCHLSRDLRAWRRYVRGAMPYGARKIDLVGTPVPHLAWPIRGTRAEMRHDPARARTGCSSDRLGVVPYALAFDRVARSIRKSCSFSSMLLK